MPSSYWEEFQTATQRALAQHREEEESQGSSSSLFAIRSYQPYYEPGNYFSSYHDGI